MSITVVKGISTFCSLWMSTGTFALWHTCSHTTCAREQPHGFHYTACKNQLCRTFGPSLKMRYQTTASSREKKSGISFPSCKRWYGQKHMDTGTCYMLHQCWQKQVDLFFILLLWHLFLPLPREGMKFKMLSLKKTAVPICKDSCEW